MTKELKDEYWDVVKNTRIEDYINPVNLLEQKTIFEDNYKNATRYNPFFEYGQLRFQPKDTINKLKKIRNELLRSNDVYGEIYARKIDLDISYISNIDKRAAQEAEFSKWLTSLYGIPSKDVFEKAVSLLKSTPADATEEKSLSSDDLSNIFKMELKKYGFADWTINLDDIPAVVSINPALRLIKIKKSESFSQKDAKRLIAHEISVHVLRNENGKQQEDKLFSYGFPDYLQTEEGLAITSEKKNGLLGNDDLRRYCSRVVASYYCRNEDFFDLFSRIYQDHSFDEAFSIVSRIKRGLIDTSFNGGYTKDQIYLSGFLELTGYNNDALRFLFCGKVGLKDIEFINSHSNLNLDCPVPDWVNELNN